METAKAVERVRVGEWVDSSGDLALGDAWVMQLDPVVRQAWLQRIHWIRLADRLAQNE